MPPRRATAVRCALALVAVLAAAGCLGGGSTKGKSPTEPEAHSNWTSPPIEDASGIHKIKHVIMIMQENRSFDEYFGTYPGADGIPMKDGVPTVCLPNPHTGQCVRPFHDPRLENAGGPHALKAAVVDIDGGKMDGFVRRAVRPSKQGCPQSNPLCKVNPVRPDVMGWHDAREIPNYWDYAKQFVLQDHMFASNLGWSVPIHLAMVSAWSAKCTNDHDPMTCKSNASLTVSPGSKTQKREFPWTDLTWLMKRYHVSWRYYVEKGTQPDCDQDAFTCPPKVQNAETPSIWNPLPKFLDVQQTHQVKNVVDVKDYFTAARDGTLPKVSWVIPSLGNSEHPRASIADGQAWVTRLVNAVMRGPDWKSTAIFIAWDDWGGFYDHVAPPQVDSIGYGIRVPGLLVSAYARQGMIDHQVLTFDAYLKFIEDDFMDGARIDPKTDGRPDSRPDVRENAPELGDLTKEFDFSKPPRNPVLLQPYPPQDR